MNKTHTQLVKSPIKGILIIHVYFSIFKLLIPYIEY